MTKLSKGQFSTFRKHIFKGDLGWKAVLVPTYTYWFSLIDLGVFCWYLYKWFEYKVFGFHFKSLGQRSQYGVYRGLFLVGTVLFHPEYELYMIRGTFISLDSHIDVFCESPTPSSFAKMNMAARGKFDILRQPKRNVQHPKQAKNYLPQIA